MNYVMQAFLGRDCDELLDHKSVVESWLKVEAALAMSQGELGIIPMGAAEEIVKASASFIFDADRYRAAVEHTQHPLVPILQELMRASGSAGRYVHFGAASQDITDTGLILGCRSAYEKLERLASDLSELCLEIAARHRTSVMIGRTHGQHAVPTTFGLKVAVWAQQWNEHIGRLAEVRTRFFVGSFGGATGTMAGYGERALELRERMMRRLGLGVSNVSWHSAYERLAEYVGLLGLLAATCDRMANEIYLLGRPEIAEVNEAFEMGMVGSSTMPHKRNPIVCEAISAASLFVQSQVPLSQRMVSQRDDRDLAATFLAMQIVPETTTWTIGMLAAMKRVLQGLSVDEARMKKNMEMTSGAFLSERVMLRLAPLIGREAATALVKNCIVRAAATGVSLGDAIVEDDVVKEHLGKNEIEELLDPATYIGKSSEIIESTLRNRAQVASAGKPHAASR